MVVKKCAWRSLIFGFLIFICSACAAGEWRNEHTPAPRQSTYKSVYANGGRREELREPSKWSLGVAGMFSTSPYKSYDCQIIPLPVITYKGDRFYIKGLEAGMHLWKDGAHEASLGIRYFGLSFKPDKSDDWQLKQLDKRKSTMMATASYAYTGRFGQIKLTASQDILGNSKGFIGDLSLRVPVIRNEKFTLLPGIGVQWANSKQNDYYFGVSKAESVRSGLYQYKSKGAFSPFASLEAKYQITEKWSAAASAKIDILSGKVKDSPMVSKSCTATIMAAIIYNF